MSNTGDQETGGASIKPSARPSIHSHKHCPFAYTEAIMGRYGVNRKNDQEKIAQPSKHIVNLSNDHGIDEVDNVFSKPTYSGSPLAFSQRNRMRRKSLDEDDQQIEKDSSNKLSQSLPAKFSLHSHCSDDSEVEVPVGHEYQYSDTSYQSASLGSPPTIRTPVSNRRTPVSNRRTPVMNNLNRSSSVTPRTQAKQSQEHSSRMLPLLVTLGVLVTVGSMFKASNTSSKVIYDESSFYNDINLLGMKYRIDENAVLQMQIGISTIFNRQDTGSFMFVYNSNDDFNRKDFNTFINDVSVTTSKYLRNESTPVHYTLVEGSNLDMFAHSELIINTFRGDLDKTGVMLVKHVEAIPSALAMAFHYYCDEYNPLVKRSAIFFTLNLAKCPVAKDKKSTHAVIEKCLAQKWNGVPADSIGPLLTRVVSVVIDLTGAF